MQKRIEAFCCWLIMGPKPTGFWEIEFAEKDPEK